MAQEPDDFEIDDPEELSQKKRVRDLLNRRNEVLDARNRAMDERLLGNAGHEQALGHYQSRIESLIIDLYTKFKHLDDEDIDGEKYYKNMHIDTITIPPPADLVPAKDADMAPGATRPDPKTVSIDGLEWFIENDPVVRANFEVQKVNPPGVFRDVNEVYLDFSTLDKALLVCMEFMDKLGIDAKLTQQEQQTKIDRELLEEVDEWRQENVNED